MMLITRRFLISEDIVVLDESVDGALFGCRVPTLTGLAISTWSLVERIRLIYTDTLATSYERCDFRWFPEEKVMFDSQDSKTVSLNSQGGA